MEGQKLIFLRMSLLLRDTSLDAEMKKLQFADIGSKRMQAESLKEEKSGGQRRFSEIIVHRHCFTQ